MRRACVYVGKMEGFLGMRVFLFFFSLFDFFPLCCNNVVI